MKFLMINKDQAFIEETYANPCGQIMITPKKGAACPYDAEIQIKGETVILAGSLFPGGHCHAELVVKMLLRDIDKYFEFES